MLMLFFSIKFFVKWFGIFIEFYERQMAFFNWLSIFEELFLKRKLSKCNGALLLFQFYFDLKNKIENL